MFMSQTKFTIAVLFLNNLHKHQQHHAAWKHPTYLSWRMNSRMLRGGVLGRLTFMYSYMSCRNWNADSMSGVCLAHRHRAGRIRHTQRAAGVSTHSNKQTTPSLPSAWQKRVVKLCSINDHDGSQTDGDKTRECARHYMQGGHTRVHIQENLPVERMRPH